MAFDNHNPRGRHIVHKPYYARLEMTNLVCGDKTTTFERTISLDHGRG
jgi:hypothetical protein